ncbi:thiamine phosphate synthase [Maricaulis sp.]|uniref:thiamine phosphate synthase n=1 Tax=Maricaulis sp. TaxID=1486257 RepID=UPI00262DB4EF|nr:thiamine phosphate synthase [Maricaulis sp.]MDF1767697.1 thiamine phosphate synthase [Maricaulis sp.]
MTSPYDAARQMASAAARVRGENRVMTPALLALTDPQRQPDPLALARNLPAGSALIYRHFGAPDRVALARETVRLARARGVRVLVSGDAVLARDCDADGVHWPERMLARAHHERACGNTGLFTGSAHSPLALSRAQASGLDAVLISTVFSSASSSAGHPMGPLSLAAWAKRSRIPVYALGGVNLRTVRRLAGFGISGVAVVGAIRSAGPTQT